MNNIIYSTIPFNWKMGLKLSKYVGFAFLVD